MENFKSFGKRVIIPFFPGFTAITGPNGSGKSNIGDAIRFVLGPKSPKVIRAERLTDLIFNGGKDKKKPANYCEVSLVFDNSDRKLPIDSDTVVLTRRIKRAPLKDNPDNFYSYFYINGRSASLADFVNLLTRARISGDGYNLVRQGDVTSLVEMGPIERRRIIDDIAGISEFDTDLDKAEKEKREVEENIQRINIILGEIDKQLSQLKKERDEAIRYKELQKKLYETKAKIAYKKKRDIEVQISEIYNQIESYEREKRKLEEEKEKKKEEYERTKSKLKDIEDKIAASGGDEAKRINEDINKLRTEIAKMEERISNIKESLRYLSKRKRDVESSLSDIDREISDLNKKIEETESTLREKEKEEKEIETKLKEQRNLLKTLDKTSLEISRELVKLREEYNDLIQREHKLNLERERLYEKLNTINARLSELETSKETYEFEIKDADWRIEEYRKERSKIIKKKEQLEKKLFEKRKQEAELNQQIRELEVAVRNLQREHSRLRAEFEANESLKKGYTTAVVKILEARDRGELKGIHGTVAELAKVDPKYEVAIQVAGGHRLQAIIVDDDEVAARAIEYLRRNNLGRATFLPLSKMISGKPRAKAILAVEDEKSHGFAMNLISYRKEYESAFWYVFGDTVVVEDLDTARKWMGGVRIVTLNGDLVEASGAMKGGSIESFISLSSIDRSKLDEIEERLRETMESQKSAEKMLNQIRKEIEDIQREKDELESSVPIDASGIEAKKKEFEAKLKIIVDEINSRARDRETVENRLNEIEKELQSLEERIGEINRIKEEKGKFLIEGKEGDSLRDVEDMEEKFLKIKEIIVSLNGEIETLNKKKNILENKRDENGALLEQIVEEIKSKEEEIESLKNRKEKDVEKMKTLLSVESSKTAKIKGLSEEKERVYRDMIKMETEIDKISTRIESYVDLISRAKYRLSNVEDALKDANEEISRYKDYIGSISSKDLPSIDSLLESLNLIEENMHQLEPVNMRALEEYEHQENRKNKLEDDIRKLREQKKNLNRVAKEIIKKKRERFFEVFDEINRNFGQIYHDLSDGGEAYLELENPNDPFSGGMNIKVKPRGKKAFNLSSLSGGEKSIASLSLIFAIQRYDPSPFYVLDEVDMFLDNVNAEMVSRMIRKNSSHAQFILVSLRKVTLKEADHIYGVTRREDGISEIIGTVDLSSIGPKGEIISGGRVS